MYLARGATFALGNMGGPVWAGQGVGGSTTINSGTCYRVPETTLADWHRDDGLTMFTSGTLSPYFERVEAMLGVETAAAGPSRWHGAGRRPGRRRDGTLAPSVAAQCPGV
jgi:choline dehydrogenase-like flavoprotein